MTQHMGGLPGGLDSYVSMLLELRKLSPVHRSRPLLEAASEAGGLAACFKGFY